MTLKEDVKPQKSEEAKGETPVHHNIDKEAGELARKAQKTEQSYDQANPIFTK